MVKPQERIGKPVFYKDVEIGTIIDFDEVSNALKIYLSEDGRKVMENVIVDLENNTLSIPIQ